METIELKELYPTIEDLPTEREAIEEIADSLEVSYRGNTGDQTIVSRIVDVLYSDDEEEIEEEPETVQGFKVINKRKNRLSIKGVEIESKGEYELTSEDLKNEILMKKINHAIDTGVLKKA